MLRQTKAPRGTGVPRGAPDLYARRALLVVVAHLDNLATFELAAVPAGTMCQIVLATVRAFGQLRRGQVLMAAAIPTAVPRDFTLGYGSHKTDTPLLGVIK